MTSSFILRLLLEILMVWRTISVIIALQARSHAEVIHEEWVLVDVLEGAELATISETQPEAVSEIVVGCQSIRFLRLFLGLSRSRSHFLALSFANRSEMSGLWKRFNSSTVQLSLQKLKSLMHEAWFSSSPSVGSTLCPSQPTRSLRLLGATGLGPLSSSSDEDESSLLDVPCELCTSPRLSFFPEDCGFSLS